MKTFAKYSIFLISLILIFQSKSSFACSYTEYGEDIRISMFRIFNENMPGFYPFKYNAHQYNACFTISSKDKERNIQEWIQELNPSIRTNDVELILYKCDPTLFYNLYNNNKLQSFFTGNTFIEELIKEKNKDILQYLLISKGIEYLEEFHSDPWAEYVEKSYDFNSQLNQSILEHLEEIVGTDMSPFLQQRYAFQYLRMLFQNNDYYGCKEVYYTHFNPNKNETILNPWALHYCAIAEKESGDSIKANYHMALVFDRCDDKKLRMYMQFDRSENMINKTLALAKTPQEKAAILTMTIVNNPGRTLNTVQEIANLDPNYYALDFLLLREINKLEDWILTPSLTLNKPTVHLDEEWQDGPDDYLKKNYEKDRAYLKQVILFAHKMLSQSGNSDYMKLALAHLYILDEQNSTALSILPNAEASLPAVLYKQNIIEQLILLSSKEKITFFNNREDAGKLFFLLDSLYQKEQVEGMTMYSLCQRYAKAMIYNNDKVRAALLIKLGNQYQYTSWDYDKEEMKFSINENFDYYTLNYFDQIASADDMDDLIAFIQNDGRNQFDSFLARQEFASIDQCTELKGSKLFREGRYKEALAVWETLDDSYWLDNGEFQYYLKHNIEKPLDLYPETEASLNYKRVNKTYILGKILDLEEKANSPGRHQNLYTLKLAHAWFNVSYYGNSWMLAHYYKSYTPKNEVSGVGFSTIKNLVQCDSANYIYLHRATKLYEKVVAESDDKELKVEALVMLQYIDFLTFRSKYPYDWDNEHPYAPKYTGNFWKEYEETDFYHMMYITCPRFEAYVDM